MKIQTRNALLLLEPKINHTASVVVKALVDPVHGLPRNKSVTDGMFGDVEAVFYQQKRHIDFPLGQFFHPLRSFLVFDRSDINAQDSSRVIFSYF